MRKITKLACQAFTKGQNFTLSNTDVEVFIDDENWMYTTRLYLHWNCIAKKVNGKLFITNAWRSSNTTKERLNWLIGVDIRQKKWVRYLNGNEWNGEWAEIA